MTVKNGIPGFHIGSDYAVAHHYDNAGTAGQLTGTGRFKRITGPGLPGYIHSGEPGYGVEYARLADSDLLEYTSYKSDANTTLARTQRDYESNRDLLTGVSNWANGTLNTFSTYGYTNDQLGRRTSVENPASEAFTITTFTAWTYNHRSELVSAKRYEGTYTPNPQPDAENVPYRRLYGYDNIGNRENSTEGASTVSYYCPTDLNQYKYVGTTQPNCATVTPTHVYDDDGNLILDDQFVYTWDAENRLIEVQTRVDWGQSSTAYEVNDKHVYFTYDYMGRRVSKRVETYNGSSWPETSDELFVYDGWTLDTPRLAGRDGLQGSPGALPLAASQGWNVVMVLDGLNSNASTRKYTLDTAPPALRDGSQRDPGASPLATSQGYTWGLDLSGSIHGAGGIGGLLAAVEEHDPQSSTDDEKFWYFYDAEPLTRRATRSVGACGPRAMPVRRVKGHGNVGQVLNATSTSNITIAAHYEYDPYGNLINSTGPYKDANPFRFSTKWYDVETGLYYYGYRYYSPHLGRWISTDPIGENGGLNLQLFALNEPVGTVDVLGLAKFVVAEASQANAWSMGPAYLRWEVGEELTLDTITCCVECKAKWKILGGLGIAYGKGFRYTVSEFTVSAGFMLQGSLVDIKTEGEAVLMKACPPWTQSNMAFDGIIAEAFFGGHVEGKLYGQVSAPRGIPVKLSVDGEVIAQAGVSLGVGATVNVTHTGPEVFSGFTAHGTVWLNAYSDLVIKGDFRAAVLIWGYEIWHKAYPVNVVESDPFGLVKYPILTF